MSSQKTKSLAMLMLMMCGVSSVNMGPERFGATPNTGNAWQSCLSESTKAARQEINNAFNATRFASLNSIEIFKTAMNKVLDAAKAFRIVLSVNKTPEKIISVYLDMVKAMENAMELVAKGADKLDAKLQLLMRSQLDYIIFLYKAMILGHISLDNEQECLQHALNADIEELQECLDSFSVIITYEILAFGQVGTEKEYTLPSNYIDNVVRDTFVTLAKAMKPDDKTSCIELLKQYYGDGKEGTGIRELYWGKLSERKAANETMSALVVADQGKDRAKFQAIQNYYNTNVAKIKEEITKLEASLLTPASAGESKSNTNGQPANASAGRRTLTVNTQGTNFSTANSAQVFNKIDFLKVKNQITEKCSLILLVANLTQILLSSNPSSIEELYLDMIIQSLVFDASKNSAAQQGVKRVTDASTDLLKAEEEEAGMMLTLTGSSATQQGSKRLGGSEKRGRISGMTPDENRLAASFS